MTFSVFYYCLFAVAAKLLLGRVYFALLLAFILVYFRAFINLYCTDRPSGLNRFYLAQMPEFLDVILKVMFACVM
jgi:hypothetical protein